MNGWLHENVFCIISILTGLLSFFLFRLFDNTTTLKKYSAKKEPMWILKWILELITIPILLRSGIGLVWNPSLVQWTLVIVNAWIVNNLSLINIFRETGRLFYNINYMLNSKHLSISKQNWWQNRVYYYQSSLYLLFCQFAYYKNVIKYLMTNFELALIWLHIVMEYFT